jgi:hypothetical protein
LSECLFFIRFIQIKIGSWTLKNKAWNETGWAWELEILILFFIALGFILPTLFEMQQSSPGIGQLNSTEQSTPVTQSYAEEMDAIKAQRNALLSGLVIIGLYIMHLILVSNSSSFISTPAVYFFSPLVFGGITFYRMLYHTTLQGKSISLIEDSLFNKVAFPIGIIFITFLFTQLRKSRQLYLYKDVDWIYKTKPYYDEGRWSKIRAEVAAFPYAPRELLISNEGLLVKGALYLLPLSFSHIQSVVQSKQRSSVNNHLDLSTSSHKPVRIQTTESRQPIMITPENPDEFVFQCAEANPHASHLFTAAATVHG